jgi:hypothetical protein
MPDNQSDRSLKKDFEDVRRVGFWVLLLLAALGGLGLQAVILKALNPGSLDAEGALSMFQVFAFTAPLTLAIIIVASVLLGPIRYGINYDAGVLYQSLALAALVFFGTAWFCNHLGIGAPGVTNKDMEHDLGQLHGTLPVMSLQFIYLLLARYTIAYGFPGFLSSIVLGAFLAWAFGAKLLPHLTRRWH